MAAALQAAQLVSVVTSHWHLQSADRRQLVMPRHRRSMFGCLAFSVLGLMIWKIVTGFSSGYRA